MGNGLRPVLFLLPALLVQPSSQHTFLIDLIDRIRFEPEEISLIMEILKDGKSREEQEQIDRMMQMVNSYLRR